MSLAANITDAVLGVLDDSGIKSYVDDDQYLKLCGSLFVATDVEDATKEPETQA